MSLVTDIHVPGDDICSSIQITDEKKPDVTETIFNKWQRIVQLTLDIAELSFGVVMKVTKEDLEVVVCNGQEGNPYEIGDKRTLKEASYGSTIIYQDQLMVVENAFIEEEWQYFVDKEFGITALCGYPIKWPDHSFYGVLMVMSKTETIFSEDVTNLVFEMANTMEVDLANLILEQVFFESKQIDSLTGLYTRTKMEALLEYEYLRSERTKEVFTIVTFDINGFKGINDNFGYNTGDLILKEFVKGVKKRIRTTDLFGRFGSDEFLLICPNTDHFGAEKLVADMVDPIQEELQTVVLGTSFSYGVGQYCESDNNHFDILMRADRRLYVCQKMSDL